MIDWLALLPVCAPMVHADTMSRVVLHESKGNPFAIGVNGGKRQIKQPQSKAEAIASAQKLSDAGYSFDVGLGQLNSENIKRLNISFSEAFDPCANLAHTSKILRDNYARALRRTPNPQAALEAALSAYNTGNFTSGISNGYVQKVLNTKRKGGAYHLPASISTPAFSTTPTVVSNYSGFSDDNTSDNYNGWL